jgi:hypothetical protein
MNSNPLDQMNKEVIARLQIELDSIRQRLSISDRGAILFRSDLSYGDDEVALVEADGFGGAILRVVEGNYPVDYFTHEERSFPTESEALVAATALQTRVSL